ncbi:MAG: class I SAM-dependent methyltransferase [Pirellulales bacterium]|nr:class I SAM-dependent methyltransferase [Pirellulales bacterium]
MPSPFETAAHDHNRRAWDARAERGDRFTQPVGDDELADPLAAVDGCGWLGRDIRSKRVLCLAAGGGRQSVLYAAAGAEVTVVEISAEMLAIDRRVVAERGLNVRCVETSMDDLSALADASFDIVIHPVSTCYVPNVLPVFAEVARVTLPGGLYISQHKHPASLQGTTVRTGDGYAIRHAYYDRGPLPAVEGSKHREEGTLEYVHRIEELLGGMCRAGFAIEDVSEPMHADDDAKPDSFGDRSRYLPPYLRVKARRASSDGPTATLWTP